MESLKELGSPEKLMDEAKTIVDGGAELPDSNILRFAETVGISDTIAVKNKDRPQERRPGLRLTRERAKSSFKSTASQSFADLETALNINELQDPDEFFDAYERLENATKEIQRQLGCGTGNLNEIQPLTNGRRRRPGILEKSYKSKHRFSSLPHQTDDKLTHSQEMVEQDNLTASKPDSPEKSVDQNPIPNIDSGEAESTGSLADTEIEKNGILDELLSRDDKDLDGDGALNILQDMLMISPLDLDNLKMPGFHDVGRTYISDIKENFIASPTTLRSSPSASLSQLSKRISKSFPQRDPFVFLDDVDISPSRIASPLQPQEKSNDQVEIAHPVISSMDAQKVIESKDSIPEQFENGNASTHSADVGSMPNEEPINYEKSTIVDQSNPSALEEESMSAPYRRQECDTEKQPEIHPAKLRKGKSIAGEKRLRKAHPMTKILAESGTSFETGARRSKRIRMRPLEYWKGERFVYGRVDQSLQLLGVKYISPGKAEGNLKVKPFSSPKYKQKLQLAARY